MSNAQEEALPGDAVHQGACQNIPLAQGCSAETSRLVHHDEQQNSMTLSILRPGPINAGGHE